MNRDEGPCRVCGLWSRTNDGDGPICGPRRVNGKIRLSQCAIIDADYRRYGELPGQRERHRKGRFARLLSALRRRR